VGMGIRTDLNATVRRTVARDGLAERILDPIESLILCHKKLNRFRGWAFYIVVGMGDSNRSKCNSPADCCA